MAAEPFAGARVLSLESRHAADMTALIRKLGGKPVPAPSMREVPLSDQTHAIEFGEQLLRGNCDVLVLLTGVGFSALFGAMCTTYPEREIKAALSRILIACRGPKPVRVLKAMGLSPAVVAPEPNTSSELLAVMLEQMSLTGKRVFVQEYGRPTPELTEGLQQAGAVPIAVPIYAWQLPDDTGPLQAAADQLCRGEIDVALFTSAQQVVHLLDIAAQTGQREAVIQSFKSKVVVASIGPITSRALVEVGIDVDTEPAHPKMGQLVTHAASRWKELAANKRA